MVKNGHGPLGLGTLKSAVSQKWTNEMGLFFASWYKFRKAKRYFNNYWMGRSKNEWGLLYHGTLKPGVSHKWFDELSRLIEWFVHVDSAGVIFGLMPSLLCIVDAQSTLYRWYLNAGGPLQLYLARVIRKNSLCAKMTLKFCHWFLLKTYLNKN